MRDSAAWSVERNLVIVGASDIRSTRFYFEGHEAVEYLCAKFGALCKVYANFIFFYGSTALYGPGPPRFVKVSWSHTFETHHSR
jgi:hypothetical protein